MCLNVNVTMGARGGKTVKAEVRFAVAAAAVVVVGGGGGVANGSGGDNSCVRDGMEDVEVGG